MQATDRLNPIQVRGLAVPQHGIATVALRPHVYHRATPFIVGLSAELRQRPELECSLHPPDDSLAKVANSVPADGRRADGTKPP